MNQYLRERVFLFLNERMEILICFFYPACVSVACVTLLTTSVIWDAVDLDI